jgi:hypothetical protein
MTRSEAEELRARAKLMEEIELHELRSTPPEVKLAQAGVLLLAAVALGWQTGDPAEDEAVRERWRKLKDKYRG